MSLELHEALDLEATKEEFDEPTNLDSIVDQIKANLEEI